MFICSRCLLEGIKTNPFSIFIDLISIIKIIGLNRLVQGCLVVNEENFCSIHCSNDDILHFDLLMPPIRDDVQYHSSLMINCERCFRVFIPFYCGRY